MPEGADGSTYYRDGRCGTGGAGAVLRVSRKLPAGSTVCRTGAGGCAGLRVPGSLHAGRVRERQQSRRSAGTYDGTGQSAGSPGSRRRPTSRPVTFAAPDTAGSLKSGIRPAPSDTDAVLSAGFRAGSINHATPLIRKLLQLFRCKYSSSASSTEPKYNSDLIVDHAPTVCAISVGSILNATCDKYALKDKMSVDKHIGHCLFTHSAKCTEIA
jgi:hypothetical protein